MGIRFYCVEEICFFFRENAYLLDDSLKDQALIRWLDAECGLPELARELEKAVQKKASLKAFVGCILNYTGFFPEQICQEIRDILAQSGSLSTYEKRKAKADMLLAGKKFGLAGREYRSLLAHLPPEEVHLRGAVYHSCGVCLAKMFLFRAAGEYFLKAYETGGRIESYRQYLWTVRLQMSEMEYLEFLKEHPEAYEDSLEMEESLDGYGRTWKNTGYHTLLSDIRSRRTEGNAALWQEKLEERISHLKDAYREMVRT